MSMLDKKNYVIVHNSYDVEYTEDVQSITCVMAFTADEALQKFKEQSVGKGYVPSKIGVVSAYPDGASALKPVSVRTITTERYIV